MKHKFQWGWEAEMGNAIPWFVLPELKLLSSHITLTSMSSVTAGWTLCPAKDFKYFTIDPFSSAQIRLPIGRCTSSFCTSNHLHCAIFVGVLPLRSNSECPQLPLFLEKKRTQSLFLILQFSGRNTCPGGGKLLWNLVPLSWNFWNPLPCPIHSSLQHRQRSWGLSTMCHCKKSSHRNSENWSNKEKGPLRLGSKPTSKSRNE